VQIPPTQQPPPQQPAPQVVVPAPQVDVHVPQQLPPPEDPSQYEKVLGEAGRIWLEIAFITLTAKRIDYFRQSHYTYISRAVRYL
jgi:hypothetical protein